MSTRLLTLTRNPAMHTCTCIYICIASISIRIYMDIFHTHSRTRTHTHTLSLSLTITQIYLQSTSIRNHIHTCIHTQTRARTHTHTHTHTRSSVYADTDLSRRQSDKQTLLLSYIRCRGVGCGFLAFVYAARHLPQQRRRLLPFRWGICMMM